MRLVLFWLFIAIATIGLAQKRMPLINSGEVLNQGQVYYDSGKYDAAITLYLTVPEQDTNAVAVLKALAFAYLAKDDFDKCLETSSKGLQRPSEYRPDFLRARAASTSLKGDYEGALKLYAEAINEFPADVDIRYSRALAYYNHKEYEKATAEFFSILTINPFVRGCHLHLGLMAIRQGRKVHGMFALGMYMALAPSDNSRLQLLNNFVDNAVTDEGVEPPLGPNASDKLDQIIRAKVAMEDGFQSSIPAKAPVIRQYELLFSQLGMIQPLPGNLWVQHYLPVYKALKEKQQAEAFIYHLLTSAPIEIATKWRDKNKDKMSSFYEVTNTVMKMARDSVKMAEFSRPIKAWYRDDNSLEALGNKGSGDQRAGKWVLYYDNGARMAAGEYDEAGAKRGTWTYHRKDGTLKGVENYTTNEVTNYHPDGSRSEHFFLKDDKIHGDVETYYPGGNLHEKLNFNAGTREGKFEAFFPDGTLQRTFTYRNGELEGEFRSYHANGKLASLEHYKAGLAEGPLSTYYATGRLESEGSYRGDKIFGDWKYYHPNGKLSRTGKYNEQGIGIGEWVFYNSDGTLMERRSLDKDGELHGEDYYFHHGKPFYTVTYRKGMKVKVVNFKEDGSLLNSFGNGDGNFACTFYYPTGERMAEGKYVKGKKEGIWKYYSRYGTLISQSDQRNDMAQGKLTRYFPSGAVREETEYVDDEVNGYVITYYANGKVEQEGWMTGGQRQQRWVTYSKEGMITSDYYFLNGKERGLGLDYALDGKPLFSAFYEEGRLGSFRHFGERGEIPLHAAQAQGKTVYEDRYASGQVRERFSVAAGKYYGEVFHGFPDGSTSSIISFRNGLRDGHFEIYHPDGSLSLRGNYVNGYRSGKWVHYHENGKLYSEGSYVDNDRDSLWLFYYDNGKLSSTGSFQLDKRHGTFRYYSPGGVPLLEKLFDEGDLTHYRPVAADGSTGPWIRFSGTGTIEVNYPDGSPAWKEGYASGERHGPHVIYYPGGKVFSQVNYDYGDYEGVTLTYYPNGQVSERAMLRNDEREGLTERFRENGTVFMQENFRLGIRYGKTTVFDEKGKVKKEYNFWHDKVQH
ncbi:MAG: tetratricopeptide repeat protein [Cyclobacteriaceae bacterium]|nr:tetratricopeptide repeat protein [Cyclobacteriaceae bacterium]